MSLPTWQNWNDMASAPTPCDSSCAARPMTCWTVCVSSVSYAPELTRSGGLGVLRARAARDDDDELGLVQRARARGAEH